MNLKFFAFLGVVFSNNFPSESKKVTPDGVVYEAYKGDAFRHITTHLIETHKVNKLGSCAYRCTKHGECVSFNFGNRINGKHDCQLLRTDKYNSGSSRVTSTEFHYFYPLNKCMGTSPCLNNGTCYPDYDNDDYNCVCANLTKGKNCEIYKSSSSAFSLGLKINGVYMIDPDEQGAFPVYFDMTTDGGGWTVIQKPYDGSVDFYRGWQDYKTGFGNLNGEFWLGLEKIHRLTRTKNFTLRVEVEDWSGNKGHALYSSFTVASENDSYRLAVSGFGGTAGDALLDGNALETHAGMPFTTNDKDNDENTTGNCAVESHGAWWYKNCYSSNLNGRYTGNVVDAKGMIWRTLTNERRGLKKAEMKIRESNFAFHDCSVLRSAGYSTDGVYRIDPDGQGSFPVYCDMTTDGGGWVVFQRRNNKLVSFDRGWQDYKTGFGNLNGEFWLGLDKILRLTLIKVTSLRVDLENLDGSKKYTKYSSFSIADESDFYRLTVSGYSGTGGDTMANGANNKRFTTPDSDNDKWPYGNCGIDRRSGWWFGWCSISDLNGVTTWWGSPRSFRSTEMKLKWR